MTTSSPRPAAGDEINAILYGAAFAPLLESIVHDLGAAAASFGHAVGALPVEQAIHQPAHCARVERLYLLPFDPPRGDDVGSTSAFVRRLFPRAEVVNPPEAHELCWDKLTSAERLLGRGLPIPESLYTESVDEVIDFVRRHELVILKERRACGGQGHVILCHTDDVLVGEAGGRRFAVELSPDRGTARKLRHGVLTYPAPFYLQRLIGTGGPQGRFRPGQILRAYLVDGNIMFWTERYRDRFTRPSDWIVNVGLGAKYRFVLETSGEARKLVLRTGDVLGIRVGAVDLIRGDDGFYVLEADTDGRHMYIDRQFKTIPEYRAPFDFDRFIAAALVGGSGSTEGMHRAL